MDFRSFLTARAGALLVAAALGVPSLAACGGSADGSSSESSTPAAADTPATGEATPTESAAAGDGETTASLTWPQGVGEFPLNVCASVGEHTIQGGGTSEDGTWNLVLDANLLAAGDTGTLTVSQTSDMSVVYDADVTDLTVQSDGSFTGSGMDAAEAPFTITGTCDVTW
ncbi:MAG TPA: hypothetical protein PLP61_00450 [Nocardioides sp.]|uniref:hypothetical protein n=1 Tax=Nocardioides sp. TaxID=35761 RepID=UPI002C907FE4|nr:hypothetical protein [Nocardioides sp.]HQR25483.1 hypothetical protein [Nocardioides sp.]